MMLVRVAREKALPFEPLVSNETTVAALREARSDHLPRSSRVDALMADLGFCPFLRPRSQPRHDAVISAHPPPSMQDARPSPTGGAHDEPS